MIHEQHACEMLSKICTLSSVVKEQAQESVELCGIDERLVNTFLSIETVASNIGWMADLSLARIDGTNKPNIVGTAEDWCSPHPQRHEYLKHLMASN